MIKLAIFVLVSVTAVLSAGTPGERRISREFVLFIFKATRAYFTWPVLITLVKADDPFAADCKKSDVFSVT